MQNSGMRLCGTVTPARWFCGFAGKRARAPALHFGEFGKKFIEIGKLLEG